MEQTAEDRRDRGFGPCFETSNTQREKWTTPGPRIICWKPWDWLHCALRPGGQKECEDDFSYDETYHFFIWLPIIMVGIWGLNIYNWTYTFLGPIRFCIETLDPSPSRKSLCYLKGCLGCLMAPFMSVERKSRLSGWWLNQPSLKNISRNGNLPQF